MKSVGFHVGRFGLYAFVRSVLKYRQIFIVPGVSVEAVKGYDKYLDFEFRFICFGVGVRLILRTKK